MTTPLARLLAAAVCAATLAVPVVLAGPASADSEVKRDPRGDVTESMGRAPRPSADVLRFTSSHADGKVTLKVDVVDLDATSIAGANFRLATSAGDEFLAFVGRDEEGEVGGTLVDAETGTTVPCPSFDARVLPGADRIAAFVPRLCLDRPRWVRTGAIAFATVESFGTTFSDDARRDGPGSGIRLGTRRLFLN